MKRAKIISYFLVVCLLSLSKAKGQQILPNVNVGDVLNLQIDIPQGGIQWQKSSDKENWLVIEGGNTNEFQVEIEAKPVHFRARVNIGSCESQYSEVISVMDPEVFKWSNPLAWGGTKPTDGEEVIIPASKHIFLDESTPQLAGLTIQGTLEFERKDLELTSEWIVVDGGTLKVGEENDPFIDKAVITLTDGDMEASIMGMGTRGIMVMSGALELHGYAPEVPYLKILDHAERGATTLSVPASALEGWEVGDEIVISPTDYYEAGGGISVTQKTTITEIDLSNNLIVIETPLNAFRWGKMQVVTDHGLVVAGPEVSPIDLDDDVTPVFLDERAEIGNLTRNIVIQSLEDDLWADHGFGVHTMIMPEGVAHLHGVEFKNAGQRGRLMRYPFHWHMLSYEGTNTLEDATGQFISKSTINVSANRGVVIHGTNGVTMNDNIIYHVRGHGVFTEDAVERRNTIDHNLVLHVRHPINGTELKQHETGAFGSSGFWISNPDNTVTNNTTADCQSFGFWLAFPEQPWGLNQSVLHTDGLLLRPNRLLFGVFDNNTAHSNGRMGIMLDNVEIDNEGNVAGRRYRSTTDGRETSFPNANQRRFTLSRYKTWKNRDNGIWDRSDWVDNTGIVSADNCGRFFAGAGFFGVIEKSLAVGTSFNHMMNGTGRPASADAHSGRATSAPCAFATYHSTFDIKENLVVNFPAVGGAGSGAFSTDDYYLLPLDKGQARNTGNMLMESHPGVKLRSHLNHFTLASAIWDPHGLWGPVGNYLVDNDPFITYGKEIIEIQGGEELAGGVNVSGPFYGFEGFVLYGVGSTPPLSFPWADFMRIHVRRLDEGLNEVAIWNVESATPDELLPHMRDFVTVPEAIYELTFPDNADAPTDFQMNVYNMLSSDDLQVMGIQFDGSIDAQVFMENNAYSELESLIAVRNSEGETFWQDHANNRVWVKMQGGRRQLSSNIDPISDEALYERTVLKITNE